MSSNDAPTTGETIQQARENVEWFTRPSTRLERRLTVAEDRNGRRIGSNGAGVGGADGWRGDGDLGGGER